MNLLVFLISFKICFGHEVTGLIKIDGQKRIVESDSCVTTEISPGWHRIRVEVYGYRDLDTILNVGDTIVFLKLKLYTVDTVISTPKSSIRSFMTVNNRDFSLQPMPLIQDPVIFVKTLPFVYSFDEISSNDLDYSAALGKPGENMLSIEGMPVIALPIYPHSLVPLPLVRKIRFYLLDIPEEIGWTTSSHVDVRLPSGGDGSFLYFDPLGTISYSYGGPMMSGGIQVYTLSPLIMLSSRGRSRIGHIDVFYKRIAGNFLFTGFGLGEMVDIRGEYEPENTKILDFGVKLSTGNFSSYIAASFYKYKVPLEKVDEGFITAGALTGWKFIKWKLNLVEEYVRYKGELETGNGNFTLESFYRRRALIGRVWVPLRFRSFYIAPFADAVYQGMYFTGKGVWNSSWVYPGIKLRMSGYINLSVGTTNQFFKLFKKDKNFPQRLDIRRRTFYTLFGINMENTVFMTFFRKNLTDSLYGYGLYGKLVRRIGEKSGVALSLWGMYSKSPSHDYGVNADLMVTRKWGKGVYFLIRVVDRFPIYLITGEREPVSFRLDMMYVRDFKIRTHPATVYAGIYNLFSSKQKIYDIKYPVPMLSFRVKF